MKKLFRPKMVLVFFSLLLITATLKAQNLFLVKEINTIAKLKPYNL